MQEWVRAWAASAEAEAPVIVGGPTEAQWAKFEEEVAGQIMCRREKEEACGVCPDCKKVRRGVHPDIVRLPDDEKTLKVKQVREAREEWVKMPFGDRRLIIIPRAERLTIEAANALLKELEDGTLHNRFLLWTSFAGRLPATIRSRSQMLRLPSKYLEQSEQVLLDWDTILNWKRKQPFNEEELGVIYQHLQHAISQEGVNTSWYRASLRLRDYYQVRSVQGNTKMASDVLLASLQELRYQLG